jgi:hypothetical protein
VNRSGKSAKPSQSRETEGSGPVNSVQKKQSGTCFTTNRTSFLAGEQESSEPFNVGDENEDSKNMYSFTLLLQIYS